MILIYHRNVCPRGREALSCKDSFYALRQLVLVLQSSIRTLGESIQALCRQVIRQCHDLHAWLFAVPLVHFLTQQSKPFSDSSLLMEMPKGKDESWWGSEGFQTRTVRDRSFVEQR